MRLTDLIPTFRSCNQTLQMAADGVLEHQPTRQAMPTLQQTGGVDPIAIRCPDTSCEDRARDRHQANGLRLARQERWSDLGALIAQADMTFAKTGGGMPVAELLAHGARSDVVRAAEHALLHGQPENESIVVNGIDELEGVLEEYPGCPWTAINVALTHMDLGWAWRGTGWDDDVPVRNRTAYKAHFERAGQILASLGMSNAQSPFFASAHAMLISGLPRNTERVSRAFEDLIDLDPGNARAMRQFGMQMLPRCHGDYEMLELSARRNAGRTYDAWGAGGYTWAMFDAITVDSEACERIDYDFFRDGIRDILTHCRDQYIVNLLAAYCANTMMAERAESSEAQTMRTRIAENAEWIVRDHMTELHPMLWAHAARGFDNGLRVSCPRRFAQAGYSDAQRFFNSLFEGELSAGLRVIFTSEGIQTQAA